MNQARLRRLEEQQTGIARKVLAAVPIAEFWTSGKIVGELVRTGTRADAQIVDGCLKNLVDQGLVKRYGQGYQRIEIPADDESEPTGPLTEAFRAAGVSPERPAVPAEPKSGDVLGRFGGIAHALRGRAAQLIALADEIDAAALEADEEVRKAGADGAQLRQLRQLLKAIEQ